MKENFQIHIWLGLLLCLLGMSCSDDTPAKGDDPGNGNTELEVNEWIESVMRSDYLWVSIRPRACFSPSYNKVKSQTCFVWLLTLL